MSRAALKRFNTKCMGKGHPLVLLIGKRGSGKTWCAMECLRKCRAPTTAEEDTNTEGVVQGEAQSPTRFAAGVLLTPTESVRSMFEKAGVCRKMMFDSDFAYRLQRHVSHKEQSLERGRDLVPTWIVLDDLAFDKRLFKELVCRKLVMNGRHLHTTVVFTFQYLMDAPIEVRSNADYVFVFAETNSGVRKRIYEAFFSMFRGQKDFEQVFDSYAQGRQCLVVDNTVASNHYRDKVFHYTAEADLAHPSLVDLVDDETKRLLSLVLIQEEAGVSVAPPEVTTGDVLRTLDSF